MLTVFSCLVPDVWNLIFDLLPVINLLAMSRACKRIRRLVKQYWTMTFRALVSHHGYVIGTPSFICASQMAGLAGSV